MVVDDCSLEAQRKKLFSAHLTTIFMVLLYFTCSELHTLSDCKSKFWFLLFSQWLSCYNFFSFCLSLFVQIKCHTHFERLLLRRGQHGFLRNQFRLTHRWVGRYRLSWLDTSRKIQAVSSPKVANYVPWRQISKVSQKGNHTGPSWVFVTQIASFFIFQITTCQWLWQIFQTLSFWDVTRDFVKIWEIVRICSANSATVLYDPWDPGHFCQTVQSCKK